MWTWPYLEKRLLAVVAQDLEMRPTGLPRWGWVQWQVFFKREKRRWQRPQGEDQVKQEQRCQGCCHSQEVLEPPQLKGAGRTLLLEATWPCWHVDFTLEPPKWWEDAELLCQAPKMVAICGIATRSPCVATWRLRGTQPPPSIGLWHSCSHWTWPASEDTPFLTQSWCIRQGYRARSF